MVAEEVIISLSGGAPWGFRLQGGTEHHRPLQVAKVRRRSKACRAGLKEDDELVAIDERVCEELSHAQAMNLIDSPRATLNLRVKRAPSGLHSVSVSGAPPPLRSSLRVLSSPHAPLWGPGCVTSPPDSEAYYGETDSDADTHTQTHRRQRRPPPHARSAGRHDSQQEEEETSEMSGYESAQDGGVSLQGQWENPVGFGPVGVLSGVPWREVVYQPPEPEWAAPLHHSEQIETVGGVEGEGEGDSGFQETGGCVGLACPPLVCPERAKEAMMLGSHRQLVPMVGPQTPISDELSTTYRDKARLAKLQRGESVVEKQVKEARTKCRSIASLLTDAPDPHSKGVLMFKKRRQRAKKYTLTCFGRAEGETGGETEGDTGGETEGETGGEEEEEGRGSSFPSGSEVDEEGFSAAYDPTWDSGYLDMLDRRSSACPNMTPANNSQVMDNPTHQGAGQEFPAYQNSCFDSSTYQSPGVNDSTYQNPGMNNSTYQSPGMNNSTYQNPGMNNSTYQSPGMNNSTYQSPGMNNSTYQSPGMNNSTYQSPGMNNSTYQSPGMNNSTYQSPGMNNSTYQSPGMNNSTYQSPGINNSTYQIPVLVNGNEKQPVSTKPALNSSPRSPVALTNGSPVGVSKASMLLSPSSKILLPDPNSNSNPQLNPNPNMNATPIPGGVMNRTARPFTSGPSPTRSTAAPVVFHPPLPAPQTRPEPQSTPSKPTAAVSMVTIPPPHSSVGPEARRAVSSTSLYIPPRPNTSAGPFPPPVLSPPPILSPPPVLSPPSILSPPPLLSPPSSLASAPFSVPPGNPGPFSPPSSVHAPPFSPPYTPLPPSSARTLVHPSPAVASRPFHPLTAHMQPCAPSSAPPFSPPSFSMSAPPPPHTHTMQLPTPQSQPPPSLIFNPYISMTTPMTPVTPATPVAVAAPPQSSDSLASREQRIAVPASRSGILQEARRRGNNKPMFSAKEEKKDVSPNPALLSMLQNLDDQTESGLGSVGPGGPGAAVEAGVESGPEEDWLRLGAEACNFMQAQRGPRPPPVAPKPHAQAPQVPQLGGKGGQLFARRQSRMDRYVVDRAPTSYHSPARPREPSPTPSLPATWKYSSNIRAPPPISYNPLLSPSCPTQAQRPKAEEKQARPGFKNGGARAQKGGMKAVDIMSHQPYQLNSSLFSYGGGTPQAANSYQQQPGVTGSSQGPMKTARVYEVKRFSTPPPSGLVLKVIAPRSATTLGEPLYRSDATSPPLTPAPSAYQQLQPQPQWAFSTQSPPPPAPTAPLPQLPILSSTTVPIPIPAPYVSPSAPLQANRQFKSAPDLSHLTSAIPRPSSSSSSQVAMVPRPRFSTSNLGLKPHVWRPGPAMH